MRALRNFLPLANSCHLYSSRAQLKLVLPFHRHLSIGITHNYSESPNQNDSVNQGIYSSFDKSKIDEVYLPSIHTVGDMLEYASNWLELENLAYGHCSINAEEDAIFLILSTLGISLTGNIETHKDKLLGREQKRKMLGIIGERITSKKPMAYLLGTAIQQGEQFYIDENVLIPRSFIGDIVCDMSKNNPIRKHFSKFQRGNNIGECMNRALDLCTGSAALAILLARNFPSFQHIDASDISPAALKVAQINVTSKNLSSRIQLHEGNLFDALPFARNSEDISFENQYDLIICNPPYVRSHVLRTVPAEYKAEPKLALDGGRDGFDLISIIIKQSIKYLRKPHGLLVLEIGNGQRLFRQKYGTVCSQSKFLMCEGMDSSGEVISIPVTALMADEHLFSNPVT